MGQTFTKSSQNPIVQQGPPGDPLVLISSPQFSDKLMTSTFYCPPDKDYCSMPKKAVVDFDFIFNKNIDVEGNLTLEGNSGLAQERTGNKNLYLRNYSEGGAGNIYIDSSSDGGKTVANSLFITPNYTKTNKDFIVGGNVTFDGGNSGLLRSADAAKNVYVRGYEGSGNVYIESSSDGGKTTANQLFLTPAYTKTNKDFIVGGDITFDGGNSGLARSKDKNNIFIKSYEGSGNIYLDSSADGGKSISNRFLITPAYGKIDMPLIVQNWTLSQDANNSLCFKSNASGSKSFCIKSDGTTVTL